MSGVRRAKTPSAGAGTAVLQALALPESGAFVNVAATTSPTAVDVSDSAAVQLYTDADIYIAGGVTVDGDDWKLKSGSYATYGVSRLESIAIAAVTGTANVKILKA